MRIRISEKTMVIIAGLIGAGIGGLSGKTEIAAMILLVAFLMYLVMSLDEIR